MDNQQINAINKVIDEYFAVHPSEEVVRSKDLMPLFIKARIFKSDHRNGLPIRDVLRQLDSRNQLNMIPSVFADRKRSITNWYFRRIDSIVQPLNDKRLAVCSSFDRPVEEQTIHTTRVMRVIPKIDGEDISGNFSPTADAAQRAETLMNENNFKAASVIDNLVPDKPGLYCVRIKEISKLPKQFAKHLVDRKHNVIYIGIASGSLKSRLNQELRGSGHGTFFRSIGAVLGFRPPKGSLLNQSNKRNYTFSAKDKQEIITWINNECIVSWIDHDHNLESIETVLIDYYKPLINIDKNPYKLQELSDLRVECVRIANET